MLAHCAYRVLMMREEVLVGQFMRTTRSRFVAICYLKCFLHRKSNSLRFVAMDAFCFHCKNPWLVGLFDQKMKKRGAKGFYGLLFLFSASPVLQIHSSISNSEHQHSLSTSFLSSDVRKLSVFRTIWPVIVYAQNLIFHSKKRNSRSTMMKLAKKPCAACTILATILSCLNAQAVRQRAREFFFMPSNCDP